MHLYCRPATLPRLISPGRSSSGLAEILLHTPGTLSPAKRELIATYVSSQNDCKTFLPSPRWT
jgi:hypothetical protein